MDEDASPQAHNNFSCNWASEAFEPYGHGQPVPTEFTRGTVHFAAKPAFDPMVTLGRHVVLSSEAGELGRAAGPDRSSGWFCALHSASRIVPTWRFGPFDVTDGRIEESGNFRDDTLAPLPAE